MTRSTRMLGVLTVLAATASGAVVHAALPRIDGSATARAGAARLEVPAPPPPPAPAPAPIDDASRRVVDLLNAERARRGLGALEWNATVAAAAQQHSDDMSRRRQMTHAGSDGSNAGARLERAGFAWSRWAENIAAGQRGGDAAYDAWFNSGPHRTNMLGNYRSIGVAVTVAADGTPYWTMVLATSA